jgi:hypothetical protein
LSGGSGVESVHRTARVIEEIAERKLLWNCGFVGLPISKETEDDHSDTAKEHEAGQIATPACEGGSDTDYGANEGDKGTEASHQESASGMTAGFRRLSLIDKKIVLVEVPGLDNGSFFVGEFDGAIYKVMTLGASHASFFFAVLNGDAHDSPPSSERGLRRNHGLESIHCPPRVGARCATLCVSAFHQVARNRAIRSSTSARGRPKRARLVAMSRRASGRRGRGAL